MFPSACLFVSASIAIGAAAPPRETPAAAVQSLHDAQTDLLEKTRTYRSKTAALLKIVKTRAERRAEELETRRTLFEKGYLSHSEFLAAQARLAEANEEVAKQEKELMAAEHLLAEAAASLETRPPPPGQTGLSANRSTIRFQGSVVWKIEDAAELANFFWRRFGKELPISAYGQTPTHDALGFDHRNRLDVAVHPDSEEGKAVIQYLTERAISFIGFGKSLAGSATGAHIHVGPPSGRLF